MYFVDKSAYQFTVFLLQCGQARRYPKKAIVIFVCFYIIFWPLIDVKQRFEINL